MDSIKRLLSAPFRNTVWGLLLALSFITIFSVSLVPPDVDGVRFTGKVQLALSAVLKLEGGAETGQINY
jgi:hypothetical protein